jgi:hypothetical protein
MSDAALKVADQLGLLTTLMKRDMLACGYIRADETEARYLDSNEPGGSSTGRFWLYKSLNGNVLFDWQLDRKHHHLFDWLGPDFQGILGSDAYEAYPKYCLVQRLKGKVAKRAALVLDLKERGMLEDTLVIWGGEFGRTPMGENRKTVGRDHHIDAFTMWMAGAGLKKGYIHGQSDELGFGVVDGKVHVHDLHATLLHLLGFDHEQLTYRLQGRDFRLTDVHGKIVKEILA